MASEANNQDLDNQIAKAHFLVRRNQKVQQHLKNIEQKLIKKNRDLHQLYHHYLKEKKDVQSLEKLSLKALFVKYLGDIHARLDIERQEYLHAYLQFESCQESIEALEYEHKILHQVLSQTFLAKDDLDELLKRKSLTLKEINPDMARVILEVENKIRSHRHRIQEIDDAILVGHRALVQLEKMISKLKNVRSWGVHEYYGKKSNSSYKKKMYVRNAKSSIKSIKQILDQFEIEIHSINNQYDIDYDSFITAFDSFVNIFYDALITDWVVQRKIKNAANALENFKDKVDRILHMLKEEIRIAEQYISQEELFKRNILIQSAVK